MKEGVGDKLWEQLASWWGIREQKRICWDGKPGATNECLYKQPVKRSAQVGTISPRTILHHSAGLPGAAGRAKLGCGFSVINSEVETHDGRRNTMCTNTDSGMNVSTSACKQTCTVAHSCMHMHAHTVHVQYVHMQ